MPKIAAPTVRLHREKQLTAILRAAERIVLERGPAGVTFAAVSERTGLARPTIYEYYASPSALLKELVDRSMAAWKRDVSQAFAAGHEPLAQVEAFISAHLRFVRRGEHNVGFALAAGAPDAELRSHIERSHGDVFDLLEAPIAATGVRDVRTAIQFVGAALAAATRMVPEHDDPDALAARTTQFVVAGLRGLVNETTRRAD